MLHMFDLCFIKSCIRFMHNVCPGAPLKFLMKSSSFIFLSGLTLGLYISVLRRIMAKAKMKMVSGFWNCRTRVGLHTQYR